MTTIRTSTNQGEAAFLLSLLQGNGFEAVLLDEGVFQYALVMAPIRIQVRDEQAAEALAFLNTAPELQPGYTPPDSDCDEDIGSNGQS